MADDTVTNSVLERKAQAQRRALGSGTLSVSRALGRSLSIAADALWGLGLVPKIEADDTLPAERAVRRMDHDMLLIILENEMEGVGVVALDRAVVTGLIEKQTLGKVARFPLDDRAYTPTDAAMMAPLIDAALPRFASMLSAQPDMEHFQGYRFGALAEDAQTAELALEAEKYQVVAFDLSLEQDTRIGRALFLFPEPQMPTEAAAGPSRGKHETSLGLVPARMQVVLTRIHIPLDKAQALTPGDVLPISSHTLTSAALVTGTDHLVARGKLGQINGFRAIRIGDEETVSPKSDPAPSQNVAKDISTGAEHMPSAGTTNPHPEIERETSIDLALDDIAAGLSAPEGAGSA